MPRLPAFLRAHPEIDVRFWAVHPLRSSSCRLSARARTGRKHGRLHCAVPMLVAAAALFALPATDGVGIAIALLSLAAAGAISGASQFWALPTAFLGGMTAAAGIATINCIANLAGFFSPSIVGWLNDITGKQSAGLMFTSAALLVGATLVALVPGKMVNR